MLIAVDIDGTIDATPDEMRTLMGSLMAAGHVVVVLTGIADDIATQSDFDHKANYLRSLGCGAVWDKMVVLPHARGEIDLMKAQWCKDNGVDIFIDNDKANARAAIDAGIPLVLVPWASRVS